MTVTGNFRLLAQSEAGQVPLGRISRRAIRPPIPLDSRIHRAREVPFGLNRNTRELHFPPSLESKDVPGCCRIGSLRRGRNSPR